ncbi:single-stranded DNA-binding protein [Oceanobacillus kimchii]|uniref:single-stranded DNA-binding protein n=1 Tax=Oceanobacillus kimchii TaxID=746691 RepID=UPI003B0173B7
MLNNINLIGRWVQDTEIKMSNNGTEILNGTLAVNDPYRQDHTDFIDITAFKQLALNTNQYTGKGSKIAVSGKLQQQRWETSEGQKRSKHVVVANQIVFLDEKQSNNQNNQQSNSTQNDPFKNNAEPIDISDSDLPF